MGKYFTEKYEEYYDTLKDETNFKTKVQVLTDTITQVGSQFDTLTTIVNGLKGSFSGELLRGLETAYDDVLAVKTIVDTDGTVALESMEKLSKDVVKLKKEDEAYESKSSELNALYGSEAPDAENNPKEYADWEQQLFGIQRSLQKLMAACIELQESSDDSIDKIKEFNDLLIDFKLRLAAVAYSTQGVDIDNIDNMSLVEKQKLLQNIIDGLTTRYKEYKEQYEYFVNDFIDDNLDNSDIDSFNTLLSYLGIPTQNILNSDANDVSKGLALVDLMLQLYEKREETGGRSVIEVIEAYKNGESFEDSGMFALYCSSGMLQRGGINVEDLPADFDYESLFWERVGNKDETIASFEKVYAVYNTAASGFKLNYDAACAASVMIRDLRNLKITAPYDEIFDSEEFINFDPNAVDENGVTIYDGPNCSLLVKDEYYIAMNDSEEKMYNFLLYTRGFEAANAYFDSIGDEISRRQGIAQAVDFYTRIRAGDNEGLDRIVDYARTGLKGYGDGIEYFVDGYGFLVNPENHLTIDEYEHMALVSLLSNGDNYDKGLLVDYNICRNAGQETIPFILNFVNPTASKVASLGSSIGHDMHALSVERHNAVLAGTAFDANGNPRGDMSYGEALFRASCNNAGAIIDITGAMGDEPLLKTCVTVLCTNADDMILDGNYQGAFNETMNAITYGVYGKDGTITAENCMDSLFGKFISDGSTALGERIGDRSEGWGALYNFVSPYVTGLVTTAEDDATNRLNNWVETTFLGKEPSPSTEDEKGYFANLWEMYCKNQFGEYGGEFKPLKTMQTVAESGKKTVEGFGNDILNDLNMGLNNFSIDQ